MKKILLFLCLVAVLCPMFGCRHDNIEIENNVEKGTATNNVKSKFIVKYENIKTQDHFEHSRLWVENLSGKILCEEVKIDISNPIKNIYQRDFDNDGRDELLIVTELDIKGKFFNFGVFTLNDDFVAKEVFYGDGSLEQCDYWFLTDENKLIHLNSIRNYANEENAVYKSRYTSVTYTTEKRDNGIQFVSDSPKKTKYEMDNLSEIMKTLSIPENAIVISNISALD